MTDYLASQIIGSDFQTPTRHLFCHQASYYAPQGAPQYIDRIISAFGYRDIFLGIPYHADNGTNFVILQYQTACVVNRVHQILC